MVRFLQHNWYYIGGAIFVLLAFYMGLWGHAQLSPIQVILVFSWMAMLVHQFEEYAWPGGFPSISNYMSMGDTEHFDSYPLNARQCWISNSIICWLFYIIPIFFPQLIWLAAGQVFAGLWQLPAHGILINKRLKSIYNPGLFATVFLQTPLAIYFIWFVSTTMPEVAGQIWWGIPVSLLGLLISFLGPVAMGVRRKNFDHPFLPRELYGYREAEIRAIQGGEGEKPEPLALLVRLAK